MRPYDGYPLLPETERDGFVFGLITPPDQSRTSGAGFLQGPDGSRAGIQWAVADSPFVMRLESPTHESWGVYRVGVVRPVGSVAELMAELEPVWPKLLVLYRRIRSH